MKKRGVGANVAKEVAIGAVVIRCGCGDPKTRTLEMVEKTHGGYDENGHLKPCPTPIIEDQGTVSFWHRNPLRRLWFAIRRALGVKVENKIHSSLSRKS